MIDSSWNTIFSWWKTPNGCVKLETVVTAANQSSFNLTFLDNYFHHYSDWVCTAVMSKWRHERSSRLIRNLSNCFLIIFIKTTLEGLENLRIARSSVDAGLFSHFPMWTQNIFWCGYILKCYLQIYLVQCGYNPSLFFLFAVQKQVEPQCQGVCSWITTEDVIVQMQNSSWMPSISIVESFFYLVLSCEMGTAKRNQCFVKYCMYICNFDKMDIIL